MKKHLSEMTLDELWQLFPIFLTDHRPCWKDWFDEESRGLREILPADAAARISHIGSTSIPSIKAKPIVDILVEIAPGSGMGAVRDALIGSGYLLMAQSENRMSFNKGYTDDGFAEKVFHLHLRYYGDNDELYFRDYLIAHPETARVYETLKLKLWKIFEHDRDAYTQAKTAFVTRYTREAKAVCGKR